MPEHESPLRLFGLNFKQMVNRIAVNIGNSRTSCGYFNDGKLIETWHYSTADIADAGTAIANRVRSKGEIKLAFCSVVPSATKKLKRSLLEFEIDAFQVSSINQSIIHGSYPNIGADRIATVAAAVRQYADHEVLLVFDFGTATTLTAVDRAGKFLGGFISLGLGKTFDALHLNTAQLPDLKQALGTPVTEGLSFSTESAIVSGCLLGHLGLFNGWLAHARQAFSKDLTVIATGGYARYLAPYSAEIDYLEPNLTLIGINLLAEEAKVLEGRV
jgi:type III pantothenate kinase